MSTTMPAPFPADAAGNDTAALDADLLHLIMEATAPLTGGEYFSSLVQRLAQSLGVDVALVTECLDYPESHVRTLAFWHDEGFIENIEFDVVGTPCEDVLGNGQFCYYPRGLTERYPEWAAEDGGVESFIGIPIHAPNDDRIIGHIAAYHRQPLVDRRVVESVFRIIAARAGAELQRVQAERARRDAEDRARQHLHELAHVSRQHSMGEMASALAHEIRQPLTSILCSCNAAQRVLDRDESDPALIRQNLERACRSAENVNDIIKSLSRYTRKAEPQREPADIESVVRNTVELFRSEARSSDITLTMNLPTRLPAVDIDRVLIPQVIMNLLRNAVDAVDASAATREVHLEANIDAAGERLVVSVSDTGKGIDPQLRERLFEPFASSKSDGMGIGLSLSRSLIEDHGGALWYDAAAPRTTFRFSLPLSSAGHA